LVCLFLSSRTFSSSSPLVSRPIESPFCSRAQPPTLNSAPPPWTSVWSLWWICLASWRVASTWRATLACQFGRVGLSPVCVRPKRAPLKHTNQEHKWAPPRANKVHLFSWRAFYFLSLLANPKGCKVPPLIWHTLSHSHSHSHLKLWPLVRAQCN